MITKYEVLAGALGVTNSTCQNWSGGKAPLSPRFETCRRIARFLTGSPARFGYSPAMPTSVTSLNEGVVGSDAADETIVSGMLQSDVGGGPPVFVTATGKCWAGVPLVPGAKTISPNSHLLSFRPL